MLKVTQKTYFNSNNSSKKYPYLICQCAISLCLYVCVSNLLENKKRPNSAIIFQPNIYSSVKFYVVIFGCAKCSSIDKHMNDLVQIQAQTLHISMWYKKIPSRNSFILFSIAVHARLIEELGFAVEWRHKHLKTNSNNFPHFLPFYFFFLSWNLTYVSERLYICL